MTHHFGVLIPSTNTTVEIEYNRLLPPTLQAHVGRLLTSGAGPFSPSLEADIDHQARLLGTAKVEVVSLAVGRSSPGCPPTCSPTTTMRPSRNG